MMEWVDMIDFEIKNLYILMYSKVMSALKET